VHARCILIFGLATRPEPSALRIFFHSFSDCFLICTGAPLHKGLGDGPAVVTLKVLFPEGAEAPCFEF